MRIQFFYNYRNVRLVFTLFLIGTLGFFFRILFYDSITFGYDQARDAIQAISIWDGDFLKIIGPMTDIPGLFHGTLYWYIISPFYFLSKGNIFLVKFFMISFNVATGLVFYYVANQITKSKPIALLSCFFFMISFEANQYARWLSNPPPALLTTLLIYYSYWLMLQKKHSGIYLFFIAWSLSIHFEFFLIYHIVYFFVLFAFTYKNYWKDISIIKTVVSLLFAIIILSPFILAEIKFGFQSTKALIGFLNQEKPVNGQFIPVLNGFIEKITQSVYFNIVGINFVLAGIVLIGGFIYILINYQKNNSLPFFAFWILSPIILFLFEKLGQYHVMLGNLFGTILLYSTIIVNYVEKQKQSKIIYVFLITLLILFQFKTAKFHQKGDVLFSAQDQLLLKDEISVLDWIYSQSNGKEFGIDTVSNPLFINTTWGFLFDSYGKQKYGRMPVWLGYPQEGVFGENIVYAKTDKLTDLEYYLIMEPPPGIPDFYLKKYPVYEDTRSILLEKKEIGKFIVEKRKLTGEYPFSRDLLNAIIKGETIPKRIVQ